MVSPLQIACRFGNINCVRFLLQKPGININVKSNENILYNKFYYTALDLACKFNHINIVSLLLRQEGIIVLHDDSFFYLIFYI